MDLDKFCRLIHSKLTVTTSDGTYEGVLKFISVSTQRVTFEHTYELPSRDYLGTMHILLPSILSWSLLESFAENFDISNFNTSEKIVKSEFAKHERLDYSEVINIAPDKYFFDYLPVHLKNCPSDFCIVDSIDTAFYKAVEHLSECASIGASFHGPKISRSGILTWICLSTPTCVFFFDIEKLGKSALEEGLKSILEDKKIEKVIHDCREAADCVLNLFDTDLNCVFDTQVADYLINMQMCSGKKVFKYVNSIDSCLFKYLNVPQQFLYNHDKFASFGGKVNFYQKRPVSKDFINILMKSCMFLLLLKDEQGKLLMLPYEQMVEHYLDSVRSASNSEVHIMQSQTEDPHFTPDCLLRSVKSVRFCDLSQTANDPVRQLKDVLHSLQQKNKYLTKNIIN